MAGPLTSSPGKGSMEQTALNGQACAAELAAAQAPRHRPIARSPFTLDVKSNSPAADRVASGCSLPYR